MRNNYLYSSEIPALPSSPNPHKPATSRLYMLTFKRRQHNYSFSARCLYAGLPTATLLGDLIESLEGYILCPTKASIFPWGSPPGLAN